MTASVLAACVVGLLLYALPVRSDRRLGSSSEVSCRAKASENVLKPQLSRQSVPITTEL